MSICSSKFQRDPRTDAFTLLEVVVVLAVIGILITLLVPAIGRTRASARQMACASNLRQIGVAMRLYAGANDDTLPWAAFQQFEGDKAVKCWAWDDMLDPYLGNLWSADERAALYALRENRLLYCPSDFVEVEQWKGNPPGRLKRSYAMPSHWVPEGDARGMTFEGTGAEGSCSGPIETMDWDKTRREMCAKLSWFKAASETLLIVEEPDDGNVQGGDFDATCLGTKDQDEWIYPSDRTRQRQPIGTTLHGTRWNYLFADGHVALLQSQETLHSHIANVGRFHDYMWTRRTDD